MITTKATDPSTNPALNALNAAQGGAGGATQAGAAQAGAAASTAKASPTATEQSERFLRLLVAQMSNQDPLNPLDNAAVTTQMAQISTVEGIENLNKALRQYFDRSNAVDSVNQAALIGKRVLTEGNQIDLPAAAAGATTAPAQGGFELDGDAGNVLIEVLDGSGNVLASQRQSGLSAGVHRFDWDGTTNSGAAAAAGRYHFRVSVDSREAGATNIKPLQVRSVTAVINGADGPKFEVGGIQQLSLAEIRAILQEKTQ